MSLPVVNYLKLPEGEDPYLEGHKCTNCGSIFLGERNVQIAFPETPSKQ